VAAGRPQAIVIVEFDTAEQAAPRCEFPEYAQAQAQAQALREGGLERDLILVDGAASDSD
jgi:uncharacterized protein (DUF1330 family)